jgi:hypothetical protein
VPASPGKANRIGRAGFPPSPAAPMVQARPEISLAANFKNWVDTVDRLTRCLRGLTGLSGQKIQAAGGAQSGRSLNRAAFPADRLSYDQNR